MTQGQDNKVDQYLWVDVQLENIGLRCLYYIPYRGNKWLLPVQLDCHGGPCTNKQTNKQINKQRYLRKIPRKLKVLFHTHFIHISFFESLIYLLDKIFPVYNSPYLTENNVSYLPLSKWNVSSAFGSFFSIYHPFFSGVNHLMILQTKKKTEAEE